MSAASCNCGATLIRAGINTTSSGNMQSMAYLGFINSDEMMLLCGYCKGLIR